MMVQSWILAAVAMLQATHCARAFVVPPQVGNRPSIRQTFGLESAGTSPRFLQMSTSDTPDNDDESAQVNEEEEEDAMLEIQEELLDKAVEGAKEEFVVEDSVALEDALAEEALSEEAAVELEGTLAMDSDDTDVTTMQSAAVEWAKAQQGGTIIQPKKKYLVIGGGWGGWGAAKALCQSGIYADVTLLDALPDPTGAQPYLSKTGKPVEAGTRGFWKDYPNINALCAELGLKEDDVFTPFTNSSFYSPDGLEATAPVFSKAKFPTTDIPFLSQLSGQTFPTLPSPLGQVVATFPLFERIPLEDRASMIGLLLATIDCLGNDESVQEEYDRMTAHDLFVRFRLSERLVEDFIKPTL